MRTSNISEQANGSSVLRIQPRRFHMKQQTCDVPVLQETLLLVELEAQEFCVDLHIMSQLVLADLGATLQLLGLVGREYGDSAERPYRIEDCIAVMGVRACVEAISAHPYKRSRPSHGMAALLKHSREIAVHSRQISEQIRGVDPDQAYFVGLCHSVGSLPAVLGWSSGQTERLNEVCAGLQISKDWALPVCVTDYFSDLQKGCISPWPQIVQTAHRLAGEGEDASVLESGGGMLWAVENAGNCGC